MSGAPAVVVLQIHGDAGDELVEQRERNIEARGCVAHGEKDRIGGRSALDGRMPAASHVFEAARRSSRGKAFVVGKIVGLAHEGVDGADGVAAFGGKRDEGVVEILGFALGDRAADGVGAMQCRVRALESFRVKQPFLSIVSRGAETAAPCRQVRAGPARAWCVWRWPAARSAHRKSRRSMARRISRPPRLKRSRSRARSRLTLPISGRPCSKSERA